MPTRYEKARDDTDAMKSLPTGVVSIVQETADAMLDMVPLITSALASSDPKALEPFRAELEAATALLNGDPEKEAAAAAAKEAAKQEAVKDAALKEAAKSKIDVPTPTQKDDRGRDRPPEHSQNRPR
jgi:hypothetical protein